MQKDFLNWCVWGGIKQNSILSEEACLFSNQHALCNPYSMEQTGEVLKNPRCAVTHAVHLSYGSLLLTNFHISY